MKKPMTVLAEGLGHPEGPYVLPDGRVVFANTYLSEIAVWEPGASVCSRRAMLPTYPGQISQAQLHCQRKMGYSKTSRTISP